MIFLAWLILNIQFCINYVEYLILWAHGDSLWVLKEADSVCYMYWYYKTQFKLNSLVYLAGINIGFIQAQWYVIRMFEICILAFVLIY